MIYHQNLFPQHYFKRLWIFFIFSYLAAFSIPYGKEIEETLPFTKSSDDTSWFSFDLNWLCCSKRPPVMDYEASYTKGLQNKLSNLPKDIWLIIIKYGMEDFYFLRNLQLTHRFFEPFFHDIYTNQRLKISPVYCGTYEERFNEVVDKINNHDSPLQFLQLTFILSGKYSCLGNHIDEATKAFVKTIGDLQQLRHLCIAEWLKNNYRVTSTLTEYADCLSHLTAHLTRLSLFGILGGPEEEINKLGEVLGKNKTIKTLDLIHCNLNSFPFFDELSKNQTITKLNIHGSREKFISYFFIQLGINNNSTLKILYADQCGICKESISISEQLSINTSLIYLSLRGNDIESMWSIENYLPYYVKALRQNQTLKAINLYNNGWAECDKKLVEKETKGRIIFDEYTPDYALVSL